MLFPLSVGSHCNEGLSICSYGPVLLEELKQRSLTLRHFPQVIGYVNMEVLSRVVLLI